MAPLRGPHTPSPGNGKDEVFADPLQPLTDAALAHGDLGDTLPGVLDRIRRHLGADTVALLLADESGVPEVSGLTVSVVLGVLEQALSPRLRLPLHPAVAAAIGSKQRPVSLEGLVDDRVRSILRECLPSVTGAALVVDSRLLGTLHIGRIQPRPFTEEEERRLQAIAGRVALAFDHARLYRAERTARGKAASATRRFRQAEQDALRLAAIVDGSEDAIIGKDLDGIIQTWNFGAERMYGYTAGEAVGRHIGFLTPAHLKAEVDEIMRKVARGERISHLETQRRRKDGELIDVALTISPIRDATRKRIVGASTIAREISDLKRAERTLRATEKLAATGRLAASIAHEINNPMASVTNLLYLLQHHSTLDPAAKEYVKMAQEELQRVTHIVRQMLGFYRESETPVPVDLKDVVENVLLLYQRRLQNSRIQVSTDFHTVASSHSSKSISALPGTPVVRGFPGEIRQVFSNLVVNAIEALGELGRIRIRVRPAHDWSNPGVAGVRVLIADDGPGIPELARRHIFEPFFTTKGERGTGLGLWVSEGIVRKHGGIMRVRSNTSGHRHGTCFSIFLPAEKVALNRAA